MLIPCSLTSLDIPQTLLFHPSVGLMVQKAHQCHKGAGNNEQALYADDVCKGPVDKHTQGNGTPREYLDNGKHPSHLIWRGDLLDHDCLRCSEDRHENAYDCHYQKIQREEGRHAQQGESYAKGNEGDGDSLHLIIEMAPERYQYPPYEISYGPRDLIDRQAPDLRTEAALHQQRGEDGGEGASDRKSAV